MGEGKRREINIRLLGFGSHPDGYDNEQIASQAPLPAASAANLGATEMKRREDMYLVVKSAVYMVAIRSPTYNTQAVPLQGKSEATPIAVKFHSSALN